MIVLRGHLVCLEVDIERPCGISYLPLPFNQTPNSETRSRASNKIYKGLAIFSCFTRHFRGRTLRGIQKRTRRAEKEVVEAGKRDGRARGRERRRGRRLIGARVPLYLNGAARWLSVSLQPPSQLQLRSLRPATSNTGTRDCRACIHAKARHSFSTPRIGLRNRISASVFSIEGWQPRAPAPGDRPTAASPFGRLIIRLVKTLSVSQRLCIDPRPIFQKLEDIRSGPLCLSHHGLKAGLSFQGSFEGWMK